MNKGDKPGVSAGVAPPALKEMIFSIIKKLEEEGITDGRRWLWAHFAETPHVLIQRNIDSYVVLLWREGVYVEITLDDSLSVTGFDVEVRP
jgi:hypothetical protein